MQENHRKEFLNHKVSMQTALLHQIFSASYVPVIISLALAATLVYIQYEVIAHETIIVWFFLTAITVVLRIILIVVYQRNPDRNEDDNNLWLIRFRFGLLVSGLLWGAAGYLLFPVNHPEHQLFLIFMLAGLTVGGIASYSADLFSSILYALCVLTPITVRLFIEGGNLYTAMGVAVLLYLGFMVSNSRRINFNICENIRLRLEAAGREDLVRESEQRWKSALDAAGDGVWDFNFLTQQNIVSNKLKGILGFKESDTEENGRLNDWLERVHPDSLSATLKAFHAVMDNKTDSYNVEQKIRCEDGSYKWVLVRGRVLSRTEDGKPIRMVGTGLDLSVRKHIEDELRIAASAFELQEGIMVTDANNVILRVNNAFTQITGYSAEEVIDQTPRILNSGRHNKRFYDAMWERLASTGTWEGEIWDRRKDGEVFPGRLTITAVRNDDDIVTNYVAAFTDISISKAASEEIKNLAFYDPLTKLPNRRLLLDRLQHTLVTNARSGEKGALLFLDLDHFKNLNDSLGHDIGDLLLQQVAHRLSQCVRECDTVARLGGDEFVVVLEGLGKDVIEAAKHTEIISKKILAVLGQPYLLASHGYHNTSSIGIAIFNSHDVKIDELLKQADIAMYQAKQAGRNTLCFFDPEMQARITNKVDLERKLRSAIEKKHFQLYYQAQVDNTGKVLGAEALIRWLYPEQGVSSTLDFISLAEETGLILPIGAWVLENGCAQLKLWQQNPQMRALSLSLNVSVKQFCQAGFVAQVQDMVQKYDIDATKLKLELTESLLVDNIKSVKETMDALGALGIKFSLDDFGVGYSSLQYLKKLPLEQLKIDQSFVRDIATDNSDKAIVLTIITMARSLGLDVIAEGVETEGQRQFLMANGCKYYQGYLFGKPLPIDEFEASLSKTEEFLL